MAFFRDQSMATQDPIPVDPNDLNALASLTTTTISGSGYTGNIVWTNPPMTGVNVPVTTTSFCPGGHVIKGKLIEYIDGMFVGRCSVCDERFEIEKIPGGVAWQQAGHFIGRALALEDEDNDSASELLGQLKALEGDIAAEEKKLAHAKKLIALARRTILKRAVGAEE